MRKSGLLFTVAAILLALIAPASAQEAEAQSIAQIAAGNADFSTLVSAAQAAGLLEALDQGGPFTVFAPTNDAFAALLTQLNVSAEDLLANTDLLTAVLLYHVAPGTFLAEDVAAALSASAEMGMEGFSIATANGQTATITQDGETIKIDNATIVAADIVASNGVIHVINAVILPDTDEAAAGGETAAPASSQNIAEAAAAAGSFTTLLAAAEAAGLGDLLSQGGPFTIFAPTDEAFAVALEELGLTVEELLGDAELLTQVLAYHIVPSPYTSTEVIGLDGAYLGTLLPGAALAISVEEEEVFVNDALVVAVDVMASNGVIHVIDSVLLPPADEETE